MKRTGRRYTEDFLEENNEEIVYEDFELKSEKANEEEYQYFDFSEDEAFEEPIETEEETSEEARPSVLKKIGKVLIVILVLIALFFASAKITEIILDHNEEPVSFEDEIPDYEEDFNEIIEEDFSAADTEIPEVLGNEEIAEPAPTPEAEETTPAPEPTPAPVPAPEAKPEPAPSPAPAPKPSITPGNPAA